MNDIPQPAPSARPAVPASSATPAAPARSVAASAEPSQLPLTVVELCAHGVRVLELAHVPTPQVDAELLLAHVLGIGRGEVQAKAVTGAAVTADDRAAYLAAIERRAAREPLQHITGIAPFRSLELAVGPGVFVPRPETEFVAQFAIDALIAVPSPNPRAVDLGTGSGAIALALATEVPHATVIAVERSPEAHAWADRNIRSSGADNISLVLGDLADALPEWDGTVDVVASNPPYIPNEAIPRDLEVRLHDPAMALYGGADGLEIVRVLSQRALALLRPGGALVIEHGELQGAAIRELLAADGWRTPETHRDLLGRDRATTATR